MKKTWIFIAAAVAVLAGVCGSVLFKETKTETQRVKSPYDGSIDYAKSMENSVSWEIGYRGSTGSRRESITVKNLDATLVSSLRGDAGVELSFGDNTVFGFHLCAEIDGVEYRDDVTVNGARINVYRHGLYYADVHVMALTLAGNGGDSVLTADIERVYHTYGDKIVENITVRNAEKSIERLWVELTAEGSLVTGENYAAIALSSGGTVGYILPYGVAGSFETETDGSTVTVRLIAEPNGAEETGFTFGGRLYYGDGSDLERQAYIEANPIYPDNYVGLCGYYRVDLEGSDFNNSYYNEPNYCPSFSFSIPAEEEGRTFYVMAHTDKGGLEASALTDGEGNLLPIAVQAGKNFTGENEEPVYNPGDPSYGESIVPLVTGSEALSYRIYHIYQNWGNYPIKQLSSIQFFMAYYHLSVGVTETTCFAMNFYTPEGEGYFITDFRGLSGEMWTSQPQFNSAGRVFLTDYAVSGAKNVTYMRYTGSDIASVGTAYTDVTMYFAAQDGSSKLSYRAVELPQTDENRNYTTLRLEFLKEVTVDNAREELRFMRFHGRTGTYSGVNYLAGDGSVKTIAVGGLTETVSAALGSDTPFFAAYGVSGDNPTASIGVIIRSCRAVIGGVETELELAVSVGVDGSVWFSPNAEGITFSEGDLIELDMLTMPYGLQTEGSECVEAVRENCGDMIFSGAAENGKAEISVENGINNVVIKASGFASYIVPTVTVDGAEIELSSGNGRADGYQVTLGDDGLYTFAFAIDSELVNGKTVVLEQKEE